MKDFKERVLELRRAWDAVPEMRFEVNNLREICVSKDDFKKIFEGEEVDIEISRGAIKDIYPYTAYVYVGLVKVYCLLHSEDLDEDAIKAINGV